MTSNSSTTVDEDASPSSATTSTTSTVLHKTGDLARPRLPQPPEGTREETSNAEPLAGTGLAGALLCARCCWCSDEGCKMNAKETEADRNNIIMTGSEVAIILQMQLETIWKSLRLSRFLVTSPLGYSVLGFLYLRSKQARDICGMVRDQMMLAAM